MHDASKVLLGSALSSATVVSHHDGDPASYKAGLAIRQKSDGTLSLLAADGSLIGVSVGRSLSATKKTSIIRKGLMVPLRATFPYGTVTISAYANLVSGTDDSITIGATVFTAQAGSATLGQATFQAATSNNATATSLAAQINAHATAGALVYAEAAAAVVHLRSKVSGSEGLLALAYTDNDTNVGASVSGATLANLVPVKGAAVYINDTTGEATYSASPEAVLSQAFYAASGTFTGVDEDASEYLVCKIDMTAGL